MRLPRKAYEDNWRDEISCRFWAWAALNCKRVGGHFWSKWTPGSFLLTTDYRWRHRICRLCRCGESERLPPTYTTASNSANITVTWG